MDEARRDELTGLISRKYFYELLDREFDKAGNSALSLCVLNIDDFKLITSCTERMREIWLSSGLAKS